MNLIDKTGIKLLFVFVGLFAFTLFFFERNKVIKKELTKASINNEEKEEYDNPAERDSLEFIKTVDPALGYVPYARLFTAIEKTEEMKRFSNARVQAFNWMERGPIFDSVGPSNGNRRGGGANATGAYTSGRMRGILVDTLNDPSGNTVFASSVSGGLWKCTNFLTVAYPNWQPVNEFFDNLAISSICQNPANPSIMYFSTGEPTNNADAVLGKGVWKSTNAGLTWALLSSTSNFTRTFKVVCDAFGNIYLANRTGSTLLRSTDGGANWTNITPNNLTSNSICTDIEISSTGRMHVSFGYNGSIVNHRYTDNPSVVSSSSWNSSFGIRTSGTIARRLELACVGNVVYGITTNSSNNIDSCYKSIDGGQTFTKQNNTVYTSSLTNTQGWYNISLAINPANTDEIIMGGLDAYFSNNSGVTISRLTYWVSSSPYVHADHHYIMWWNNNFQSRLVIGCDGGIFYSSDGGIIWVDKNRNLGLKQFYACAIHPIAGTNYFLAGSQDNGVHQLKNPGLSYSIEVTGGDGCYVHINQQNPSIQYGSYVYNNYRRSTNGGLSWSSFSFSNTGLFVNPFDYDDTKNILYACGGTSTLRRWVDANISTSTSTAVFNSITLSLSGTPGALKVSPYTPNRVFIGSSNGDIIRLDNADTITSIWASESTTNIRGSGFPSGFINCINTGTSDNVLVACFTNYGVSNVWVTTNGGINWTAIDGNLPDMPVRWAVFVPGSNSKMILATEAGIYSTELIDGSATVWAPHTDFPTIKTTMLKIRTSDNTILASSYGRGLWTGTIPIPTAVNNFNNTKDFIKYTSGENKQIFIATGTLNTRQMNVQLYDLSGKMIYFNRTNYQNTFIRNINLTSGIYILKIEGDKKEYFVQKVMVR